MADPTPTPTPTPAPAPNYVRMGYPPEKDLKPGQVPADLDHLREKKHAKAVREAAAKKEGAN